MIKINGRTIDVNKFPDGTLLIKEYVNYTSAQIEWYFENNEELISLIYITNHLRSKCVNTIELFMPYIPNARQDRVKEWEDVFTLKYFASIINSLKFDAVAVFDPHSSVSEALINDIAIKPPKEYIEYAFNKVLKICSAKDVLLYPSYNENDILLFYPDEGAMKRYSGMFKHKYAFGIKERDWNTGKIKGLEIAGNPEEIKSKDILIVDDICSRGGTFYHSAKKLKELGANRIFLYVSHCENTIFDGKLLDGDLVEKVFTTNSIPRKHHNKIEVVEL